MSPENDLSTDELFATVLEDLRQDDDSRLSALVALHGRPAAAVVDRSLLLCASTDAYERTVGLRVLRELRHQTISQQLHWDPIEPVVIRLANDDDDPDVVRCAISCLGYQARGHSALSAVVDRATDPNASVRLAAADALPGLIASTGYNPRSVEVLAKLTADDDPDVRSYALMGLVDELGLADDWQGVVRARLNDTDEQIRRVASEALGRAD